MNERYTQLDALRGLAAITVFFSHTLGMTIHNSKIFSYINNSSFHIFYDGASAVNLFFILSGFCLSVPYIGRKSLNEINYFSFIIKRVFRIYPVFIFSIFFSLLLKDFFIHSEWISEWGQLFWNWEQINNTELINSILLIGYFDTNLINPPIWSLAVEMQMSFFIPLMIIISKRINSTKIDFIIWFLLTLISIKFSLIRLLTYAPLFYGGIILAKYRIFFSEFINSLSIKKSTMIGIIAIILYTFRFSVIGMFNLNYLDVNNFVNIITSIGGFIIIILFFRISIIQFFSIRLHKLLGKLSYGLYLFHFPILLIYFSKHSFFHNNSYLIIFISFLSTCILSCVMFNYVEKPFINFAKMIIKWSPQHFFASVIKKNS